MSQTLLGTQEREELLRGIEFHAEAAFVEGGCSLGELRKAPVAGVAMIARVGHLALHLFHDEGRRGQIGIADPQADDIHPARALLGDLALHLGEEIGGQVVHPSRESHHCLLVCQLWSVACGRWPSRGRARPRIPRRWSSQRRRRALRRGAGTPWPTHPAQELRRELAGEDLFRGPGHEDRPSVAPFGADLDDEVPTQKMHQHRALDQPQAHARGPYRRGPRTARLGLPHTPLPDPHAYRTVGFHADEFHVHPIGEDRVALDGGAHAGHVEGRGVLHLDDAVRVADVDEGEAILLAGGDQPGVDDVAVGRDFGPRSCRDVRAPKTGSTHVDPHQPVREEPGPDGPRQGLHDEFRLRHRPRASQVAGEYADAVAAHLRLAAVGVEHPHPGHGPGIAPVGRPWRRIPSAPTPRWRSHSRLMISVVSGPGRADSSTMR